MFFPAISAARVKYVLFQRVCLFRGQTEPKRDGCVVGPLVFKRDVASLFSFRTSRITPRGGGVMKQPDRAPCLHFTSGGFDQSSGCIRVIQPSWSVYHTVTGVVELSIQLSRSNP